MHVLWNLLQSHKVNSMPRNAKKLGKITHTFLAERWFYTQLNRQSEPLAGAKREQLVWSQVHQGPQCGDLVFSRLGSPPWTTKGLGSFSGSSSEAVMEQSIYAFTTLGHCTAQLPVLAQVTTESHLWPHHSNTATALYPEGSCSIRQFSYILCHLKQTPGFSKAVWFPLVKCLILQSIKLWKSVNI